MSSDHCREPINIPTPCASGNSIEKGAAGLFLYLLSHLQKTPHLSRCQRVQLPAKHYHTFSKLLLAKKRVSNCACVYLFVVVFVP